MINIDELKQNIEQRTGVPASLLTGETAEENIAQAKAFLAYKRDMEAQRPKSTNEQFAEWLTQEMGIDTPQDATGAALAEIEEQARVEASKYPLIKDGGEVTGLPDGRSASEQFAEWIGQKLAFDPRKQGDGWKRII